MLNKICKKGQFLLDNQDLQGANVFVENYLTECLFTPL